MPPERNELITTSGLTYSDGVLEKLTRTLYFLRILQKIIIIAEE